ncbi:hypothetical protein LPB67_14440 [Undibacterium sp. Jales W-56]|uniref:hypothetical protein n=1 Tax=Undibacterium sp. Jales W-56 TaxID=2897325 RepID=UPI0021CEF6B0|nr:hypothetical protein [Undibacterium sp. Jales W-56]MCU6434973.1 hypothetical protein [Undibacterium sp. Jales W-56]
MKARHYLIIATTALVLSACGGSDSGYGSSTPPPPAPPPPSFMDTFTNFVASLLGKTSEDQEPQAIDAVTVTTPEDSEPAAPI